LLVGLGARDPEAEAVGGGGEVLDGERDDLGAPQHDGEAEEEERAVAQPGAGEPQRDLDARVRELAEHEAALLAAYTKAGAQASDLSSAAAEYEVLAVRAQEDEAALAEAREAKEALRVALSGRTPEQLQPRSPPARRGCANTSPSTAVGPKRHRQRSIIDLMSTAM
jgi:hypothetical protein